MERTDQRSSTVDGITDAAAAALATLFGGVARLRAAKSIHPRGAVVGAMIERLDHRATGIEWVDEKAPAHVIVRISRSVGLPRPLPDVLGMAVRVPLDPDGFGDLLLSTGAKAPYARHAPVPRRDPGSATFTSLVPFRTPVGLRMIAALSVDPTTYLLVVATPRGAWSPFARLLLDAPAAEVPDEEIDFDPVAHPLPGLTLHDRFSRLRQPSYAASRSGRRRPWPPR